MSSARWAVWAFPAGLGVLGAIYTFKGESGTKTPELTGMGQASKKPEDGRSQAAKDGQIDDGPSSMPRSSLKSGGASPALVKGGQTVAGRSSESIKTGSADHNVETRSNPKEQDGTSGGGQGVAQMRERKMEGRGLPSPQGGDTPAKPVQSTTNEEMAGGVKPAKKWWLGGW